MEPTQAEPGGAGATRLVVGGLGILGFAQLTLGGLLYFAPGSFYEEIAAFAPRNDHFLRDGGAFTLALALLLLAAVRRPSWRVPALAALTLQSALHSISHLVDIENAQPGWLGYANFVGLLVQTGFAALLLARASDSAPPDTGAQR